MPRQVKYPAKIPTEGITYEQAIVHTRFWWLRYEDLPWWRLFAKKEALECATSWGRYAKQIHTDPEVLTSEDVQPSNDSSGAQ